MEIKPDKKAPAFTLVNHEGKKKSLESYKGKLLCLYFYPKDETPGCTTQACDIRDNYKIYQNNDIVILGVSSDSIESHKKFKEHHKLPFTLLSDADHAVAKAYGAASGLLGLMGMNQRKTYLIDQWGNLIGSFDVNIPTHKDDILAGFGIKQPR